MRKLLFILFLIPFCSFGQMKYKLPPYAKVSLMNDPNDDTDYYEMPTVIAYIPEGDTVELVGYDGGAWIVKYKNLKGSILPVFIDETKPEIIALQKKLLAEREKAESAKKAKREAELAKRFGPTAAKGIANGNIWVGMTGAMARESIGEPERVNRSSNRYGTTEQWVYRDRYLYFNNGKLESYQSSY